MTSRSDGLEPEVVACIARSVRAELKRRGKSDLQIEAGKRRAREAKAQPSGAANLCKGADEVLMSMARRLTKDDERTRYPIKQQF